MSIGVDIIRMDLRGRIVAADYIQLYKMVYSIKPGFLLYIRVVLANQFSTAYAVALALSMRPHLH